MKVGIIGTGGREHAIGKTLYNSRQDVDYYYYGAHPNIGLEKFAKFQKGEYSNHDLIKSWGEKLDWVIIGPEKALEEGVVDILENIGTPCIGPNQVLAKLETSKLFCRKFLKSLEQSLDKILNPEFIELKTPSEIIKFTTSNPNPFVIKKDGLAGGKGVFVMGEHFHTYAEAQTIMLDFLNRGIKFIVEEKLEGEEFSLMVITDGKNTAHCPPIQDFKRAYKNGPNTGGMGCTNYLPFLSRKDIGIATIINEMVIRYLPEYCKPYGGGRKKYKGILYGSFIKTKKGIRVIEYNCRFGDPEVIQLLASMKSDFFSVCSKVVKEKLSDPLEFDTKIYLTKYIVPEGYPEEPYRNYEFYAHKLNQDNIIWSSAYKTKEHTIQLGSRIFAYTMCGDDIERLRLKINEELDKVQGRVYYRKDIGYFEKESKYEEAGVNIDVGNEIVRQIQPYIRITENKNVLSSSGGFNGMIKLGKEVLVSSMDGVGTKSILSRELMGLKGMEYLGMDLVNHCINDILVSGATPLFFLDYFASSKLEVDEVVSFVSGVSQACAKSNVILAGGETAEMPQVYNKEHCDLVGTIVGKVKTKNIINGKDNIEKGDYIIGLRAEGLHTNGYSLIRKLLEESKKQDKYPSQEILGRLCSPHKCYLEEVQELQKQTKINGLCHITGGGLVDNPPRVLNKTLEIKLKEELLFNDPIYEWIESLNYVSREEMMKVFNCGYGMLVFISPKNMYKLTQPYTILGTVVKKTPTDYIEELIDGMI